MLLAKSTGNITLLSHSTLVSHICEKLIKKALNVKDDDLIKSIKIGGLLHDIAKALSIFQKMLKKQRDEDSAKNKFRHNEIGWAFLYSYLNVNDSILSLVLDMIYWHHGISNEMGKYTSDEILDSIADKDAEILIMKNVLVELLGAEYLLSAPREDIYGKKTPIYYTLDNLNEFTEKSILCRTCLISADRLASKLEESKYAYDIDNEINLIIAKETPFKITTCPSEYNKSRFDAQLEIAKKCSNTTIVKGPGGFGKTCVGLIWASLSNKKVIWACPRNGVAESAYISLKNEIESFGLNIKMELFLTGEIKEANYDIQEPFTSDIIVTNIDNFLSPTVSMRSADRLFLINNADVIFDEYHELTTEAALFACSINIMRLRNMFTDSRTLFLSATPIAVEFLWNTISRPTLVLPNAATHYKAAHDRKALIRITDNLPKLEESNTLYLTNAISNAQDYKDMFDCNSLIHSGFTEEDKHTKILDLYTVYGKSSIRNIKKPNVMGTRIIQASFDISFQNVSESVLSPEATMQALPRGERWGDYIKQAIFTTYNVRGYESKAENKVRDILYEKDLTDIWFEYLRQFNGTQMSFDELYCVYNEYSSIHKKEIKDYILRKYRTSRTILSTIYPKHFRNISKTAIKTAGSNKLRSVGNEIFVTMRYYNSDKYTNPISTRIYKSIDIDFDETSKTRTQLIHAMQAISKSGDERFEYEELLNNKENMTLDAIRKYGLKSNTPYIRFDQVYHPDYGGIKPARLENILKSLKK